MERVSLAPDAGRAPSPATMPLMPVEFCDRSYREYIERMRRAKRTNRFSFARELPFEIPPCRLPPYKRDSFINLFS